jgi:TRAP-type C4-dicarboxylate transport system substrate-binding protein
MNATSKRVSRLVISSLCAVIMLVIPAILVAQTAGPSVIELKYSSSLPPTEISNYAPTRWAKELEQRTSGKAKITFYHNELLGKQTEMINMLKTGVCDIALISFPTFPGMFPISDVVSLPFVAADLHITQEVYNTLFQKGILAKEFAGFKVLWFQGTPGNVPIFRNQKIATLEELKGKKIRVMPGIPTKTFKALGASPIGMPSGDVYMALERGTVDGAITSPYFYLASKMFEVTKYVVFTPISGGGKAIMMSPAKWNSLPPDIRAVMEELSAKADDWFLEESDRQEADITKQISQKVQTYSLSPEEYKRWQKATEGIVDEWVAEVEAKGLPGREAVKTAKDIAEKISKR